MKDPGDHSSRADFRRIELSKTDFGNTLRTFGIGKEGRKSSFDVRLFLYSHLFSTYKDTC